MNKTIVVGTNKGGAGKSTLVMSIAAYALKYENIQVLIVDSDPTGVLRFWSSKKIDMGERNLDTRHLPADRDLSFELGKLRANFPNHLILFDCGGFDNMSMRSAMISEHCDLVVVPSKCSPVDLFAMRTYVIDLVKHMRANGLPKHIVGVLMENSALPSQANKILDAKDALKRFGVQVLQNFTVNRTAYRDNYLLGGDATSDPKAMQEIKAIFNEIKELIH